MSEVKISVIMPSLNVGKFIGQCIESVINQTLEEIEILCVDAGSTDGTLEILEEYAKKDSRISIIHSDKKSYGYQMNLGLKAATGEYIGIVETDDYAENNMFKSLYDVASADNLDVVKSGFYFWYPGAKVENEPMKIASNVMSKRVFCPATDFKVPLEMVDFYNFKPSIWSAIYKRDFIEANKISFTETPGASFQDTSFNFKVMALAKRVKILSECFLHYRQDNVESSVNNQSKIYCVCDEYAEIEKFLLANPVIRGRLEGVKSRLKYDAYMWNYNRLNDELKREFIEFMSKEFKNDMAEGDFEMQYFPEYKWNAVMWIIKDPEDFHKHMIATRDGEKYESEYLKVPSRKERVKAAAKRTVEYGKTYGFFAMIKKIINGIVLRIKR